MAKTNIFIIIILQQLFLNQSESTTHSMLSKM